MIGYCIGGLDCEFSDLDPALGHQTTTTDMHVYTGLALHVYTLLQQLGPCVYPFGPHVYA